MRTLLRNFARATIVAIAALPAFAQIPLPPVVPFDTTSMQVQPIYTLNVAPVSGASKTVVGGYGQAKLCYWAVANFQVGSEVSRLGCVPNAPNTLTGGNYVTIAPFNYPPGTTGVDILQNTSGENAPTGACNCAVATGLTSGSVNQTSNTLSSYTVPNFNPNNYVLTLTNEVVGSNSSHYILRQGWPYPGTEIADLSTVAAGGCGTGTTGNFLEFLTPTTCGNAPVVDEGAAGIVATSPATGGIFLNTGSTTGGQLIVNGASAGTSGTDEAYIGTLPFSQIGPSVPPIAYGVFTFGASSANVILVADALNGFAAEGISQLLLSTNITSLGAVQWSLGDKTPEGTESGNISGIATATTGVPNGIEIKIPSPAAVSVLVANTTVWGVNSQGVYGMQPVVFSTLAACTAPGNFGSLATISDSTTATWGATITGTGTHKVLGFCDGTNWTVAAI